MKPSLLTTGLLVLSWTAFAQPICWSINTPPNLPAGFAGTSYSQALVSNLPSSDPGVWSLTSGTLPAGLSLSSSGVISGVPTTAGTSLFAISVSAPDSYVCGGYQVFTLTILPGSPRLAITPATLPSGAPGYEYTQYLAAAGGVPPYTWSLTSGALPSGLALLANTYGAIPTATVWIYGAPASTASTSTFTVKVTDSTSAAASSPTA